MNVFHQFDNIQIDRDSIIREALLPFSKRIVELLLEQHHKGIDGFGNDFNEGKYFSGQRFGAYSLSHSKPRRKSSLQTEVKDFHFSGFFHKSIKTDFKDDGLDIITDDSKATYIIDFYGNAIMVLTQENMSKLSNEARDSILLSFKSSIYGTT